MLNNDSQQKCKIESLSRSAYADNIVTESFLYS